jgi:hypothetical protein
MSRHGDNETLRFNGFSGYYGSIPNGYGGFDWTDVYYVNNSDYGGQESCDQGYHYPIDGRGEAVLGPAESGTVESANLSETFTLKSMLAESGATSGAPILFTSYTYSSGTFAEKAADWIYVTPGVMKIDFATLGEKGDFQNIAAMHMLVGSAAYGTSYGHDHVGNGLVFDNLKVHWNGKIPGDDAGAGHSIIPQARHAAQLLSVNPGDSFACSHSSRDAHSEYHSSPGHTWSGDDFTSQFALPHVDHSGS